MFSLLLESAARSLVLGIAVWVVLNLARIKIPQLRSQVWTVVLLSAVTMPALIPLMRVILAYMPAAAVAWIPSPGSPFFLRPLTIVTTAPSSTFSWSTLVMMVYLLVAAAFAFRLLAGVIRSRRLQQASLPLEDSWTRGSDVRVNADLAIPVTYASTILLPADAANWSALKRQVVLLHEQAHVRRRDFYVHLLANLHRAVFWFNPLAWWLERELLRLAEESCDDDAIRGTGDPVSYAQILVEFAARQPRTSLVVVAMARGGTIQRRVERALQGLATATAPSRLARISIGALLVPVIALAAGSHSRVAETVIAPALPQQPSPSIPLLVEWPAQEVPDIISNAERDAFGALRTDEERERFIEQFWLRRDPTPGTPENEFRDEYYRRIVVANRRFSTAGPGWRTDRGRVLVMHGEPDEIESHPEGRRYRRTDDNTIAVLRYEQWRYRFIEGLGRDVIIEFVDLASNGDYRLQFDSNGNNSDVKRLVEPVR